MSDDSRIREGHDDFGKFWEEETGRGWRKLRREVGGVVFQLYGAKTVDYMKAIRTASPKPLRLNVMSDRIELGEEPITDFQEAAILNLLQDYGMNNVGRMRTALQEAALRQQYHPVREYLDGLPAWDGVSRFDELMGKIDMKSPVDDYDLSRIFWRKWFIGSVAKALDGAQNFMLVLLSRQGTGKSTLVSWLCPKRNLFYEGPINPENADDKIRSINHWVWEVAELDSTTRRAEVAALKFFVTQKWVTVRVPYGRYDIRKKAAASYIGTINPDGTGFLQDVENRRFAVVHLEDIDFSYTEIDRDQLWAEIYHAYRAGETHELTRHEREIQNEINAGHVTESPLEGLILEHYDLTADERHELTSTQLLEELEGLGLRGDQFKHKMELGKILARHNVKRGRVMRNGQKQYVYKGIKFRDKGRIVQL